MWAELAEAAGVAPELRGPLAAYFRVADWRRLCVELLGALSRE